MPTILYIDTEADLLDLASTFFEDENLPIETCANFSEAKKLVGLKKYDLVISHESELLDELRRDGMKTILLTGGLDDPEKNFDGVLLKPIRFQDLITETKRLLKI